jgi:hypothetical protein
MTKDHWEHLKENDPIQYYEMNGDPVTGLNNDSYTGIVQIIITIVFLAVIVGTYIILK